MNGPIIPPGATVKSVTSYSWKEIEEWLHENFELKTPMHAVRIGRALAFIERVWWQKRYIIPDRVTMGSSGTIYIQAEGSVFVF